MTLALSPKLAQYTMSLFAEPLLLTLRARQEVKANKIRAEGQAETMEILAIGEARAELAGKAVRDLAEDPQGLAALIENEIDRRVESHYQKRVNNLAQIVARAERALPQARCPMWSPTWLGLLATQKPRKTFLTRICRRWWARVLAGEVASPGSTSLRTMNILRNLDQRTALIFRRLCSLAVSMSIPGVKDLDHRVISLKGKAAQNSLQDYGLAFDVLNLLNEHELIIADYNSWFDYRSCIARQKNRRSRTRSHARAQVSATGVGLGLRWRTRPEQGVSKCQVLP